MTEANPQTGDGRAEIGLRRRLSAAQAKVVRRAYARPGPYKTVCPTPGLWAASQTAVIRALRAQGLITTDSCPILTDAGLALGEELSREERIETAPKIGGDT